MVNMFLVDAQVREESQDYNVLSDKFTAVRNMWSHAYGVEGISSSVRQTVSVADADSADVLHVSLGFYDSQLFFKAVSKSDSGYHRLSLITSGAESGTVMLSVDDDFSSVERNYRVVKCVEYSDDYGESAFDDVVSEFVTTTSMSADFVVFVMNQMFGVLHDTYARWTPEPVLDHKGVSVVSLKHRLLGL